MRSRSNFTLVQHFGPKNSACLEFEQFLSTCFESVVSFSCCEWTAKLYSDDLPLRLGGGTLVATSQTRGLDVRCLQESSTREIASRYASGSISGESVIHICDAKIDIITDPFGFSKVFVAEQDGFRVFGSSIEHLAPLSRGVDHTACASFLLNGSVLNGRTIFDGIRFLDRSSIHCSKRHIASERYWDFEPSLYRQREKSLLMRELWDGIVESVNSLCKNRPVLLPLSGGYDSSVLLGALKILGHTNVTCFSFVAGRPRRGSDADVARKQAGVCGYPHLAIDISDSKLYETMTLGRIAGQTLRVTPDEISGYAKLADIADGEAIMAFGEESFGYDGWVFEDPSDVLASVILHSPHAIPLPHDVRESLISEYRTMYGRAASLGNYYNENDYLYLDHRLSMNMLPLRTYSAAHWFDICSPFLSPPLLGVVAALSPSDRRNKALYKSMAKAQLPELFSIRRAYRSQTTSVFLTDVLTNREQYLARAECERWNVPDLIDVAQVQDLIRQGSDRQGSESAYRAWAETALYAIGMHEKAKDIIVARRRPRFNRTPDRLKLLRRIMTLAFALQHRSSGPCRIKTAEAT